ncbi:hypothetical protein LDENG_00211300 [Lucifuga dentata]|nr:hypothetical protein LDENG_00211300 [Lucifuga dentata]
MEEITEPAAVQGLKMQDNFLRVFLLALGLIMYPNEDPRVEDDMTMGMQVHKERLLREGEKLDAYQEMTPVNPEMTDIESKGSQDDSKNIHEAQNESTFSGESENDEVPLLENVILAYQKVSEENRADPNWNPRMPQKSSFEPEMSQKILLVDQEDQLNVPQMKASPSVTRKEREDIQTGSVREPSITQSQKEIPEGKEVIGSQQVSHLTVASKETLEMAITDWEDYLSYILNMFSIISMIRFFIKCLKRHSQTEYGQANEAKAFTSNCITSKVPLSDSDTLQRFHSKYIQVSPNKKFREDEFLEGFAHDLLDAMKTICDRNGSMMIEGFQMLNVCDIIVPFSPPEPYSFQCLLRDNQGPGSTHDPGSQSCPRISSGDHSPHIHLCC